MPEKKQLTQVVADELEALDQDGGVTCEISAKVAFSVVHAIQIASQHPGWYGPSLEKSVEFANALTAAIGGPARPATDAVIQAGWIAAVGGHTEGEPN